MPIIDSSTLGILATIIVTSGCMWQLYKILKTKNVSAVRYPWLGLISLSLLMWLLYGVALNDWILIISNAIVIFIYGLFMSLKYYYEHKSKV